MSKLKNAPLLEVIFELRWDMRPADWSQYPYLQGDLYALLKHKYPLRELLVPVEVPQELLLGKAVYRFRTEKKYPLFQVGPGLITLNTTDDEYEWESYCQCIKELLDAFSQIYITDDQSGFIPSLSYYDFLKIDWQNVNVLEYISENLNIDIRQDIHNFGANPNSFNWGIVYPTDWGNLTFRIDTGSNHVGEKGLVMQIQLHAQKKQTSASVIGAWLHDAHSFSSEFFKKLTKGGLYESFT